MLFFKSRHHTSSTTPAPYPIQYSILYSTVHTREPPPPLLLLAKADMGDLHSFEPPFCKATSFTSTHASRVVFKYVQNKRGHSSYRQEINCIIFYKIKFLILLFDKSSMASMLGKQEMQLLDNICYIVRGMSSCSIIFVYMSPSAICLFELYY